MSVIPAVSGYPWWHPGRVFRRATPDAAELVAVRPEMPAAMQLAQLRKAVAEIRTLMEFAVTSNRKLDDKIIEAAMEKIGALGDLSTDTPVPLDKEAAFWKVYQTLAQATVPVTAASIESSRRAARTRFGTTARHAVVAALLFVMLAVLQVLWVIGTTLRTDLDKSDKAIAEQEDKRRPLDGDLRRLSLVHRRITDEMPRPAPGAPPAPPKPDAAKQLRELDEKAYELKMQTEVVDQNLEVLRNQREPLVELIQGWYTRMTVNRWPMSADEQIRDLEKKLHEKETAQRIQREVAERAARDRSFFSRVQASASFVDFQEIDGLRARLGRARDQRVVELKHRADLILETMQKYVFPVLLGLLGALTYILRTLIVEIRGYSHMANFSSLSLVRISLGMMAGLLGGMLLPQGDNVLKSLPPLGLSFLFGYAVEVVFAFLDRIVKAFVEDKTASK